MVTSTAGEKLRFARCWREKGRALEPQQPSTEPLPHADAVGPCARFRALESLSLPTCQVGTPNPLPRLLGRGIVFSLLCSPGIGSDKRACGDSTPALLRTESYSGDCLMDARTAPSFFSLQMRTCSPGPEAIPSVAPSLSADAPLSALKGSHQDLSSCPGSGARW